MSTVEYLIEREQEELEAALNAADARARRLHIEAANRYTLRIEEIKRRERLQPLDVLDGT